MNLEEAIEMTKNLIGSQIYKGRANIDEIHDFDGYHKVYFQTNENVAGYLDLVDLTDKSSALCVAASGDQAFSLINKGLNNIQLFYINKLTEYFVLGLKRAMILKYNYQDYIKTFNSLFNYHTSLEELTAIIIDLTKYMDYKYKVFWLNIANYNYKLQQYIKEPLNLFDMLCNNFGLKLMCQSANYLQNPEAYNYLQSQIAHTNIKFAYSNASLLAKNFKGNKYDIILLSNILDYMHRTWLFDKDTKLKEYIKSLEKITNQGGIIFLHYVFREGSPIDFYPNFYLFDDLDLELKNIPDSYELEKKQIILKRMR